MYRWTLGDFEYHEMYTAAPVAAGVLFATYQVLIFVFGLNLIIAVLCEAYETTSDESKAESSWQRFTPSLAFEIWLDLNAICT